MWPLLWRLSTSKWFGSCDLVSAMREVQPLLRHICKRDDGRYGEPRTKRENEERTVQRTRPQTISVFGCVKEWDIETTR